MLPLRAVPPIFISPTWAQAEAHMRRSVWETLRPSSPPSPSPEPESSTPRQIVMPECATEPYNPHLLGQAAEEGGNDGGTGGWTGRKRGRMMEWLLNIQHAAESMRRVVGSLHYGAASRLHVFIFSSKVSEENSPSFLYLLSFVPHCWYF